MIAVLLKSCLNDFAAPDRGIYCTHRAESSRIVGHNVQNHSSTTTSKHFQGHAIAPDQLPRIRTALLGLTLFGGLLIWVGFSLGLIPWGEHLLVKLRVVVGVTWLYALIQVADLRLWHSRFTMRRRASSRIPETLEGWLLGQLIAWFGMAYYALTNDARFFAAGVLLLLATFAVFPARDERRGHAER